MTSTREEHAMTSTPLSRRDVLKGTVTLAAAVSVGIDTVARPRRAVAQERVARPRARIDEVLRQAADAREVPGVVAMAATDKGLLYEGAFGTRDLGKGPVMTLDTVFRIASMTKAVTCVAAMQLVEQGKLTLDEPVPNIDPALGAPQVLEGFDAADVPRLRPAKRPITLRHLLTHTAGFSYEVWDPNTVRYVKISGMPSMASGKVAALRMPLAFDPGDKWEYGVNIDWVGRLIETLSEQPLDVYFRDKIFAPLGMQDSGYVISAEQRARQASVHQRQADGGLVPQPLETPSTPEFWPGGGGLYSTGRDYLTFLQMLLH
jgi:CubicO group peptidase (beta-lactamase class C family)